MSVALVQAVAGGFLLILVLALIIGGLITVAVFGRAAGGRPDDRPAGARQGLILGRMLCAIGLGSAAIGALFVSVGTDVVGMVLGMMGYYLGARVFGVVLIVLSTITLFIGLLVGQGAIPGSYDQIMNGFSGP